MTYPDQQEINNFIAQQWEQHHRIKRQFAETPTGSSSFDSDNEVIGWTLALCLIISCQFIIITIITIWVLRGGKPEEEEYDSDDVEVQEAGKVAQRNVITPVPSPEPPTPRESLASVSSGVSDLKKIMSIPRPMKSISYRNGWNRDANLQDLYHMKIVDKNIVDGLETEQISDEEFLLIPAVSVALFGYKPLSGILTKTRLPVPTDETETKIEVDEILTFEEAYNRNLLSKESMVQFYQAQAATGNIVDPKSGNKMSPETAYQEGIISKEIKEVCHEALQACTGFAGGEVNLKNAWESGDLNNELALRFLSAQLATGGVIDPMRNIHVADVEEAKENGLISDEMLAAMDESSEWKFNVPATGEETKETIADTMAYNELVGLATPSGGQGAYLLFIETPFVPSESSSSSESSESSPSEEIQIETQPLAAKAPTFDDFDLGFTTGWERPTTIQRMKLANVIGDDTILVLKNNSLDQETFSKSSVYKRAVIGESPIAGILDISTGKTFSFIQANAEKLISDECMWQLLEAQAATGRMIDPETGEKKSILNFYNDGHLSERLQEKCEEAEKACIGYEDETSLLDDPNNSGTVTAGTNKKSLLQALNDGFVDKNKALRWFDAQIATGGVIDPVKNLHVGDEYAINAGLITDDLLKQLRQDGETGSQNETWMYVDPNSSEENGKCSYHNLVKSSTFETKENDKSTTSILCLHVDGAKIREKIALAEAEAEKARKRPEPLIRKPSVMEYGNKSVISEFGEGSTKAPTTILENPSDDEGAGVFAAPIKSKDEIKFKNGWGGYATLASLFEAGCIGFDDTQGLCNGVIPEDSTEIAAKLKPWLFGLSPIAGLETMEGGAGNSGSSGTSGRMTILEAQKRGIINPGTATSLLEAQAATGAIIDPVTGERYNVKEAAGKDVNLIEKGMVPVLKRSENAVKGYVNKSNPSAGRTRRTASSGVKKAKLNLFEAMEQGLVVEQHGIRCLEAQLATGGIVDVNRGHRVPLKFALETNLIDKDLNETLSSSHDDTKGFLNPNTNLNEDYREMLNDCVWDEKLQLWILPYVNVNAKGNINPTKEIVLEKTAGRAAITLQDVMDADLIDAETLVNYKTGKISEADKGILIQRVEEALEGYNPIAGVYDNESKREMTITTALKEGFIRRAFAIDLLEAQASCGRMIDMERNKLMSFSKAKQVKLFPEKILNNCEEASQAFTGYTVPHSSEKLSILEAVDRKQISIRNASKFLEAQLATGGIIDRRSPLRFTIEAAVRKKFTTDDFADMLKSDDYKARYWFFWGSLIFEKKKLKQFPITFADNIVIITPPSPCRRRHRHLQQIFRPLKEMPHQRSRPCPLSNQRENNFKNEHSKKEHEQAPSRSRTKRTERLPKRRLHLFLVKL